MEAYVAHMKQYSDIVDYLFKYAILVGPFDDMIEEDPERFERFQKAVVSAAEQPVLHTLALLRVFLLSDVRYRRFFIVMQHDLERVLESIPLTVTVPIREHFNEITCHLLGWLSDMAADCHCFVGSEGRFVD